MTRAYVRQRIAEAKALASMASDPRTRRGHELLAAQWKVALSEPRLLVP